MEHKTPEGKSEKSLPSLVYGSGCTLTPATGFATPECSNSKEESRAEEVRRMRDEGTCFKYKDKSDI